MSTFSVLKKPIVSGIVAGLLAFVVMVVFTGYVLHQISVFDRWGISGDLGEYPNTVILLFVVTGALSALLGLGVTRRSQVLIYVSCLLIAGHLVFLAYHWGGAIGVFRAFS